MGLLDKLWDDVVAGPQPEKGLGRLRKDQGVAEEDANQRMTDRRRSGEFHYTQDEARRVTQSISIVKPPRLQMESDSPLPSPGMSPRSPSLASPSTRERDNIWRSVFHPGQNKHLDTMGSAKFDKHNPNQPTVYDWLYNEKHRNEWR